MKYRIFYHPDVKKEDLPAIPSNIRQRIKRAIEERLLNEPLKYGSPLKRSLRGYRKLRIGDYRVIYRIEEDAVVVLKIGHRKDVYNKVVLRT